MQVVRRDLHQHLRRYRRYGTVVHAIKTNELNKSIITLEEIINQPITCTIEINAAATINAFETTILYSARWVSEVDYKIESPYIISRDQSMVKKKGTARNHINIDCLTAST